LGKGRLEIFYDFLSDDVRRGKIGAVFEALVFEPEPSRGEASETDGAAERLTERERRSQHVEMSVESPASPLAALRVQMRRVRPRHIGRKLPPPSEARISS